MLKAKINTALYSRVELTDVDNNKWVGWLVPSHHNPKEYMILPIDLEKYLTVFSASAIKSIKYLFNGYVIK